MTKMGVLRTIAWIILMTAAPRASAQVLNFTADLASFKTPKRIERFRADLPSPHFPAGAGVWGVMFVESGQVNVGNFAAGRLHTAAADAPPLTLKISLLNENGDFSDLYETEVKLVDPLADHVIVPILPDAYDRNFPGFADLMMWLRHRKKGVPLQVKVRLETSSPEHYVQNGFVLDDAGGLGRYQAWLDQEDAERKKIDDAKIPARTKAVRDYRSKRSDAKFEADARTWWKKHNAAPLQGVKVCSELIIGYDRLRQPNAKQLCALYTYRDNGKCWAQTRRLSYRRLGGETYDRDLVDASFGTMSIPVGDEQFMGGAEYEISCR